MIICTQCGHENEDEDGFCGSCGEFLEWSGERV
ncbi:MAG: zinc-ribbon domain-containing protein, partial [Acidimicrobiia bacterium]